VRPGIYLEVLDEKAVKENIDRDFRRVKRPVQGATSPAVTIVQTVTAHLTGGAAPPIVSDQYDAENNPGESCLDPNSPSPAQSLCAMPKGRFTSPFRVPEESTATTFEPTILVLE
jgi:hypothetical protein